MMVIQLAHLNPAGKPHPFLFRDLWDGQHWNVPLNVRIDNMLCDLRHKQLSADGINWSAVSRREVAQRPQIRTVFPTIAICTGKSHDGSGGMV